MNKTEIDSHYLPATNRTEFPCTPLDSASNETHPASEKLLWKFLNRSLFGKLFFLSWKEVFFFDLLGFLDPLECTDVRAG